MSGALQKVLRAYLYEDRTVWPENWPEAMGVVCLWHLGEIQGVHIFHEGEEMTDVMDQALDRFGISKDSTFIHPRCVGFQSYDLKVTEDADISDQLGLYFSRHFEIVEDAEDYYVNYDFALSEGLGVVREEIPGGSGAAVKASSLPGGYFWHDELANEQKIEFERTYIDSTETGCSLVFPQFEGNTVAKHVPVLSHQSGVGFAFQMDKIIALGAPPSAIELPDDIIPVRVAGARRVPAIVVQRGDYLFVTPVLTQSDQSKSPDKNKKRPKNPRNTLRTTSVIFVTVFLLACLAFFATEEPWDVTGNNQIPVNSADKLRSMMFHDSLNTQSETTPNTGFGYLAKRVVEKDWLGDLGVSAAVDFARSKQ